MGTWEHAEIALRSYKSEKMKYKILKISFIKFSNPMSEVTKLTHSILTANSFLLIFDKFLGVFFLS